MIKFAVYWIPQTGEFYQRGSELLGYDIRLGTKVSRPDWLDPAWTAEASEFGFHLTLTDAVEIEHDELPSVASRLRSLLACFSPLNRYHLEIHDPLVSFWPAAPAQAALRVRPSPFILMLHTALVMGVQSLGHSSPYTRQRSETEPAHRRCRIDAYHGPFIFDDFEPHLTLINPYRGTEHESLRSRLNDAFDGLETILEIRTICLVVQHDGAPFTIHEELALCLSNEIGALGAPETEELR